MGLARWALKGHYKKLRESPFGRALSRAFEESGFNDGSSGALQHAAGLYKDFYMTIGAAHYVPDEVAAEFAKATQHSRYPVLFNVALDYALNQFSRDQLVEFYRGNEALVLDTAVYVDAIFPDFYETRPRSAANFTDVHAFQTQMYVLVNGVDEYLGRKGVKA